MRLWLPCLLALLTTAHADIITDVRICLESQAFPQADTQLATYRAQHGVTPEYLEAYSWMGRAYLKNNNLDQANTYARKTEQLATQQLKTRSLDAESHLPTALGAAIEVEAQVLTAKGAPALAVALLKRDLLTYRNSSIRNRLQKNLNLLALVGKPAPPLQLAEYLGPKPVALAQLKGSPVLLFFWAHWCAECKAESPSVGKLLDKYREGYDVVYGRRSSRTGETRFKRFTAWAFYRTMRALVHRDLPADVGDFRLISRECLEALKSMRETHRFLRGMLAWVGFGQVAVDDNPNDLRQDDANVRQAVRFGLLVAVIGVAFLVVAAV